MKRHRSLIALAAMAAVTFPTPALAANVWLSLNLQFNAPGNFNSGGTWTAVAKADPQGLAGVSMYLSNSEFGSFLAPLQLDVRVQTAFGSVRNVTVGDDLLTNAPGSLLR